MSEPAHTHTREEVAYHLRPLFHSAGFVTYDDLVEGLRRAHTPSTLTDLIAARIPADVTMTDLRQL